MDHVRSGFSKEFHRTLRRRRRRLTELGEVTYVDHPPRDQVESVLNEGLRLEAEGWKGREGVAVLNRPTHERWYRSVAEVAEDEGWLRLSSLYMDDRLLAFRYDLQYGSSRHGLISSYDESPDVSFSTGSLLLESVLEQSATDALRTYEFGYGNHPWKYDWTSDERRVYDLLIFGSGLAGRAVAMAKRLSDLIRDAEPAVVGSAQG
jgi:CelD/BcsL family acetyltransferase involved in cellulose biosynthesis